MKTSARSSTPSRAPFSDSSKHKTFVNVDFWPKVHGAIVVWVESLEDSLADISDIGISDSPSIAQDPNLVEIEEDSLF